MDKKVEKIKKFINVLNKYGDIFFSFGDIEKDYEHIINTLEKQGYYSGFEYKYFFDKDFNLIKIEKRGN